jgi:hypothetical protein
MRIHRGVLVAVGLSLAGLACGSGALPLEAGAITPVVQLPPEWTPTPAPSAGLPAGWEPLYGAGVELWLPGSFEGGDPTTRRDELIANLSALGAGYESLVALLESGAPGMAFFAYDSGLAGATVGITRKEIPSDVGMDRLLEEYAAELPSAVPGAAVLGYGTMPLQGAEAGKLTFELTSPGGKSVQVTYFIRSGEAVYRVSYSVPQEYFAEAEPAFEVSIGSFRVTP